MEKPKPPLSRMINESCYVFCKVCGSTMTRKPFFLGKRSCDQIECDSHIKIKAGIVYGRILYR